MSNIEKNKRIAKTMRETRKRHSNLSCKTYTVKVDKSKLRKALRHKFKMLFVESKWLSNAIIASNDLFNFDTKVKEVPGLDKDRNPVIKPLNNISSQMKQGVLGDIKDSIHALSATKKKGKNVGRLKFKREVNFSYSNIRRRVKYVYQYIFKDCPDEDTWNLNYNIAKYALPRLKRFKELLNSYPPKLTPEKWDKILDKMIFSLERIVIDDTDDLEYALSKKQDGSYRKYRKQVQEGLDLFGKYFLNLWD